MRQKKYLHVATLIHYFLYLVMGAKKHDRSMGLETSDEHVEQLVMPGDHVVAVNNMAAQRAVVLGPGLQRDDNDKVTACKCGVLQHKPPNVYWVESYQHRYVPVRGEAVIGVVMAKNGDFFRVDIGAHEHAVLSYLAFESATKRNRPDVNVGDLIYARLIVASRDMEAELACVNSLGKKGKMGILHNGFVFNCSLNLARRLLRDSCPLLNGLKKEMPYEIAVGLNGRIWIRAQSTRETIALGNAILAAENSNAVQIQQSCNVIGNILFT